jgi:hypothetical protein
MPSTLPTLTWQMTALRIPAIVNSPQAVLDTVALCVGDSTTWEVKNTYAGSLVLGCVAGSATPDLRVIVNAAINTSGATPWSGQMFGTHSYTQNDMYLAVCPDNGVDRDPYTNITPSTVAATRFSEYSQCSMTLSVKDCNNVFVLTADEVIAICFQSAAGDDWWGCVAGAMFDPPTDADGEGTPGRLYGLATCGDNDGIGNTFWSINQGFMSNSAGNDDPAMGCFDPVTPANFRQVDRYAATIGVQPSMSTALGTQVSLPFACYFEDVPQNYVGVFRQMRFTHDGQMRQIIQNAASVDQSYWVSRASGANGDVLSFDQG